MEKMSYFLAQAYQYRAEQESLLKNEPGCKHCNAKKLGDVTTLNVTGLKAGLDGIRMSDCLSIQSLRLYLSESCLMRRCVRGIWHELRAAPSHRLRGHSHPGDTPIGGDGRIAEEVVSQTDDRMNEAICE